MNSYAPNLFPVAIPENCLAFLKTIPTSEQGIKQGMTLLFFCCFPLLLKKLASQLTVLKGKVNELQP